MSTQPRIRLWSIGGGKGGVGKSIVALGLGVCLAQLGKKVVLIDGDLGGANLHTLLGVRYPEVTLEDFLLRRVERLEDTLLPTRIEGIQLICGADDILGAANPTYSQKIRLVQQIERLEADFVLMDLGAGTSFNTLDLFNHFLGKIVVFTGQVTSLQNAYGFIKSAVFRKLSREFAREEEVAQLLYQMGGKEGNPELQSLRDLAGHLETHAPALYHRLRAVLDNFCLYLVVNMVKGDQDLRSVHIIQSVCEDFLSLRPHLLGHLPNDPVVEKAVNQMDPLALYHRRSPAGQALKQMARSFLFSTRVAPPVSSRLAEVPAY